MLQKELDWEATRTLDSNVKIYYKAVRINPSVGLYSSMNPKDSFVRLGAEFGFCFGIKPCPTQLAGVGWVEVGAQ